MNCVCVIFIGAIAGLAKIAPARDETPKTLFQWASTNPDEEKPEEESDRIVTDRPHFSEASSLVGLGRVQLETGYSYFRDTESGVSETHSFPEPLVRAGLFAEWFEFRIGYNYLVEKTVTNGASRTVSGSDDLYVGAKLALAEQAGWLPEIALFPQFRLPSGAPAFTSNQVLPGFNLAYSWVLNDWLELECNTQLNRRLDDSEHYYAEFIQTANLEYDLTEQVGAFTEFIAFIPCGAIRARSEYYFHAGFVYFLTDNIQLDIHSGVGLNGPADNLAFTGVGFSIRR